MADSVPGRPRTPGYGEIRKRCDSCKEDGIEIISTGFCKDCKEFMCHECCQAHRKPRKLRGHNIVPVDESGKDVKQSDEICVGVKDVCSVDCPVHPEKNIEYFCKTHIQLCCAACSVINHKACADVVYIPDTVSGLTESDDFLQLTNRLREIEDRVAFNKAVIKTNLEATRAFHTIAKKQSATLLREITELVEKKKSELDSEADLIFRNDYQKMKEVEEKCNDVTEDLAKITSKLSELKESRQLCQLFINSKEANIEANLLEDKVHDIQQINNIQRYAYEPNAKLTDLKNTLDSMGKLVQEHTQKSLLTYLTDINVASTGDKNPGKCCISGLTIVSERHIAATDIENSSAKLIDMSQNKLVYTILLESAPRDISKITDEEVVVTLPESKKLQFLSVSVDGKLYSKREVDVWGKCYGIVCTGKELIVSFIPNRLQSSKIKILDMNGNVMKTLTQKLIGVSGYLALSNDKSTLYVSDLVRSSVTSVSMEGKDMVTYYADDLKTPLGLVCTRGGSIYVCGHKLKTIYQLSTDFNKVQVLLINTESESAGPISVDFSDKQHKLYIGLDGSVVKVISVI